jgi:hypothetical protein
MAKASISLSSGLSNVFYSEFTHALSLQVCEQGRVILLRIRPCFFFWSTLYKKIF